MCSKLITVGDVNENQLNLDNNKFRDILTLNNMENVITEPTRISPYSRTLLDSIGITRNISYLHSGIFETDKHISDHFGTFIFLKNIGDTSPDVEWDNSKEPCFRVDRKCYD